MRITPLEELDRYIGEASKQDTESLQEFLKSQQQPNTKEGANNGKTD
jgi:hypothetical protein